MASRLLPTICAFGALGIASACAIDSPLAPTGSARASSAMTSAALPSDLGREKPRTVLALSRDLTLAQDVSATAAIGARGGTLSIPEAGVTVVFPPGAVRSLTRITMTAKAGSAVAYEFEPHGLTFEAPVRVVQDLTYTDIKRGRLSRIQAGYYQQTLDAIFVNLTASLARVTELRDVDLDDTVNPRIATFYISHFSGYIMSSGFADGGGLDTPFPQQ